jgi:thiol-disulfide isomerase/thioredoxin
MGTSTWHRRQFLSYLGLSALGTVALSACRSQPAAISASPAASPGSASPATSSIASAVAATGSRLPEFQGITEWLNSGPIGLADLTGKVVLVQIWTFACINCQRTLPHIVSWHQKYASKGLQVIGVHTPEFAFERDRGNVLKAIKQHGITYPVAIDNDFKTWKAYQNEYWPHLFLADRQGIQRYDHIGEGAYDETEKLIQTLLG